MNFLGHEYYKLNRRLLLLVGLWPYEHSVFKYCQMILCNIIVIMTTVCQIAKLIELRQDVNLVMKLLSPIVLYVVYIIKYQTFCIVAKKIRHLMKHIEEDWNMLKDKKELEIIGRYTYIGSVCTLCLTILGSLGTLTCFFLPFAPSILDIFMPLNVSRPRQLLFPGEYFVDQEKYFYAIWLHLDITLSLVVTTLIGTESLYIIYIQHVCGMFQVASYRLYQAFDKKVLQAYAPEKRAIIVYRKIIEAIYIHNRTIEFFEFLWSTLMVSYSILLTIGITSLVMNLFCLFYEALFIKQINEIMRLLIFIVGQVFYFFLGNLIGQIVIDHSTGIFQKTYITRWHSAPVRAQKLLPFIMQRSMKSCKMDMGGIFVSSFEGFASLMSTTLSYFTVLWSVHK
ncbi:hypothetical protein DMN91_009717 [Ooceraea biroi]|uniref:Odorant receptor n=1 Tax=Ooceraea biroi TaxID=2015173 RepID=A0A026VSR4_OOCBI|nr:uncharacterized protein LOC105287130 [Ooceraea biroi]EZA46767.1 hypothetical protein X777_02037 [Ooceraea biroi]RLU17482.1 hypothetical protein DMN91_009717 [Ooceraea biroi]